MNKYIKASIILVIFALLSVCLLKRNIIIKKYPEQNVVTSHSAKLLISGEELIDDNCENSTIDTTYIKWLNTEEEGSSIFLNMENTDTCIYLDQLIHDYNLAYIDTIQGGKIICNEINILKERPMEKISFSGIHGIEEGVIKGFSEIDNLKIELKSTYTDYIPVEEVLFHQGCSKSSIWYSGYQDVDSVTLISHEEAKVLEIKENEVLMEVLSDNSRQLKAIYRLLGSDYEYISYEVKESGYMNIYLCIKDQDSGGELYFDWIALPAIPLEEYTYLDGERLLLEDINFDGYDDILFMGYNDFGELYKKCQGFIWNKEEKKYEYVETLPINFDYVDEENHRITYHTSGGVSEDNYYVYEYVEGEFQERYLQLCLEEERVVWRYYEDEKLLEELQLFSEEGKKSTYIFQNFQTEQIEKGSWEGEDSEYYKLGKRFFPKFDFYYLG